MGGNTGFVKNPANSMASFAPEKLTKPKPNRSQFVNCKVKSNILLNMRGWDAIEEKNDYFCSALYRQLTF